MIHLFRRYRSGESSAGLALLALVTSLLAVVLLTFAVSGAQSEPVRELFVYVSPSPGAHWVSAKTTIAFRPSLGSSIDLIDSLSLTVLGSESGLHQGNLFLADDHETIIFKPAEAFDYGETVRLTVDSGGVLDPFDLPRSASYEFFVSPSQPIAVESDLLDPRAPFSASPSPILPEATAVTSTTHRYRTAPADFPIFEIESAPGAGEGYIFIGYFNYLSFDTISYLLMLDDRGEPIFYRRFSAPSAVLDFKKQPNGLLTYFDPGPYQRKFVAMDDTYSIVGYYQAGNGYPTDLHDLQLRGDGHALLLAEDWRTMDLRHLGGHKNAQVLGCIIQELDSSGNVIFEWKSFEHISIHDTDQDLTQETIRYIHCNSVGWDLAEENILLSSRHLNEVTKINRATGDIMWRLGGEQSYFTFPGDIGFSHQHDARRLPNGNITVYDNHWPVQPIYSRAVEYRLDTTNWEAINEWEFYNTPLTLAGVMGNHQRLPGGNSLIGWGWSSEPVLTEVTPAGEKVFELSAETNMGSYRVFRFPWHGNPPWSPKLVAERVQGKAKLYFSWNGGTEITAYRIYADQTSVPTTFVAEVPRSGFETTYIFDSVEEGAYYYRVMPVDQYGNETIYSNIALSIVGGYDTFFPFMAR